MARVDEAGLVTALASGSTVIKVTCNDGGYHDECVVAVNDTSVTARTEIEFSNGDAILYPNPVSEKLYLKFSESLLEKKVNVYNTLGQLLLSGSTRGSQFEIDVTGFSKQQILFVRVSHGEKSGYFKVLTNIPE